MSILNVADSPGGSGKCFCRSTSSHTNTFRNSSDKQKSDGLLYHKYVIFNQPKGTKYCVNYLIGKASLWHYFKFGMKVLLQWKLLVSFQHYSYSSFKKGISRSPGPCKSPMQKPCHGMLRLILQVFPQQRVIMLLSYYRSSNKIRPRTCT